MAERLLKVGFDFDDVLVATAECTVALYNEQYGTNLTVDDWYNFNDMSRWGTDDFREAARRVTGIFASDEFADMVEELEQAQETVGELHADEHVLSVITGRPERLRPQTVRIAERLFPGMFPSESIHFTDHFSDKGIKITKGEVGRELGLTHYFDDQIVHAESVAAAGIKVVLLGRRAWNAGEVSPGIVRVANWQEARAYLAQEAGERPS